MSPLAGGLLLAAGVAALPGWRRAHRPPAGWTAPALATALLVLAAATQAGLVQVVGLDDVLAAPLTAVPGGDVHPLLTGAVAVAASVAGGGPLTAAVLDSAARETPAHEAPAHGVPARSPEDVLRGGAWIGALERAAVTATLLAGWPEGLVVVLAVKGLGRYTELRYPGAAERFIIGTFASVLWACACAGIVLLPA